jgi:DNA replicative helicase MCM subunit Mcm2 (Cdc46/Mcm family)
MRRLGSGAKTITATPRQLESLIRLSEALAKMRFADWVEPSDVSEAIRLMKVRCYVRTVPSQLRTDSITMYIQRCTVQHTYVYPNVLQVVTTLYTY